MKENVRLCLFNAVLVSLLLPALYINHASTTESNTKTIYKLEGCKAAVEILQDTWDTEVNTDVGFSEYDFCKIVCESEECKTSAKILKDSIDQKANPCDDFYQYACGMWPQTHQNLSTGMPHVHSIALRYFQNKMEILEFLRQNNSEDEHKSVHLTRQLYSMCLDPKSYGNEETIKKVLKQLSLRNVPLPPNSNSSFDYVSVAAKATKTVGIYMYFSVLPDVNPQNSSSSSIWLLKPTPQFDFLTPPIIEDREPNEIGFMNKVLEKMREKSNLSFRTQEDNSFKVEVLKQAIERENIIKKTKLQFNSSSVPTIYSLQELQNITDNIANDVKSSIPKFNWTKYIEITSGLENEALDLGNASNVRIFIPEIDFVRDMIKFIHQRNIAEIEFGLWWKIVSTLLPFADFDIFQANFDNNTFTEDKCYQIITKIGVPVTYMYLKNEKYRQAKIQVETMANYVKESYKKLLEQVTWITDPESKEKFLKKLEAMRMDILYPDLNELIPILDKLYGNINITGSYFEIIVNVMKSYLGYNGPNNSTVSKWAGSIPTITNAFYSEIRNALSISAAFVGPPLYTNSLKAMIFGSIGSVIGHEITHGFIPSGVYFNSEGVYEKLSNETELQCTEKIKCFVKAYDSYNSSFQGIFQKSNSSVTTYEDIPDNVGFKAAFFAYKNYVSKIGEDPSLCNFERLTSEQLFTLAFANTWCEIPNNRSHDPSSNYSPKAVRVNGVFKNSQELSRIWNCPKGSNMNPENEKCSIY